MRREHAHPGPRFESLEARQLLSASLVNGVLTVTGTNAGEAITVSRAFQFPFVTTQVYENGVRTFNSPLLVSSVEVDALAGNDTVRIGAGVPTSVITGGAGNDYLRGGDYDDKLAGESGIDSLDGGGGNDALFGGADFDWADYRSRLTAVRVVLDDSANDGAIATAERDNAHTDIEGVFGGAGNDVLVAQQNSFNGNRLIGNAGHDDLTGGPGPDLLEGDVGFDELRGRGGHDVLLGGAHDDLLDGGSGNDHMFGGDGDDLFFAADLEFDRAFGEAGADTFNGDFFDDWTQ